MKYRLNVAICDMAHLLARHGNKRIPDLYQPNFGRLAVASKANVTAAQAESINFELPFLHEAKDPSITLD